MYKLSNDNAILMRVWRNWQTRQIQVLVYNACRFKSCHPHHCLKMSNQIILVRHFYIVYDIIIGLQYKCKTQKKIVTHIAKSCIMGVEKTTKIQRRSQMSHYTHFTIEERKSKSFIRTRLQLSGYSPKAKEVAIEYKSRI